MASVYKCRDNLLERDVALKVMPRNMNARRLKDELDALLALRSKHVVQVYDVCIDQTSVGIIQEFIGGHDLFAPENSPRDANHYLLVLWQMASGISEIHEAGLIHRDIKPNNMKIDEEGILKIFDFGLSRSDGPNAATVGFVGTPGYSAPEQYSDDARFSSAVDTYAFAATALSWACRGLPKELLKRPPELKTTHHFQNIPFRVPDEVAAILATCLAERPENRPAMGEVRDIISKFILAGKHKALVVLNGRASYLDANRRTVSLNYGTIATVEITYDGIDFLVSEMSGDVFANNAKVSVGFSLPGACVLTLGGPHLGRNRAYVTFDLSHPEIVL